MRLTRFSRTRAPLLSSFILVFVFVLSYASHPLSAQTTGSAAPSAPAVAASGASTTQGSVWPSVLFNGLFGGPSDDLTHYFERYGVRTGFGSDPHTAWFTDASSLSLVYHDGRRDVVTVERRVSSRYNQRASARIDTDRVRVTGGYTIFRQGASGHDYLFTPSRIDGGLDPAYTGGNVGYVGRFNDNVVDPRFATTRTTYDVGFEIKPATLGEKASLAVTYRGIDRSGQEFKSLLAGGGDVVGTNADQRAKIRWQGYDSTVDNSTSEVVLHAALRPARQFNLEYELGYEQFGNDAATLTFADLAQIAGVRVAATAADAGAAGAINAASADKPLHFVPDSKMVRQSLRVGAGTGKVLVSAGAGWNTLEQKTFTTRQVAAGYRRGDIESNQLFVTAAARPSSHVRVEGYVRRSETNRRVDEFEGIQLNAFTLWTYGAEAEMRARGGRVVITPGWTRRTADRDIEFTDVPQQRSLFRGESSSDEIFVRTRFRLSPRVSLRFTPSVLWADQTGFVTEPERAAKMNAAVSYANASGTTSATAFYTIRTRRNDAMSFVGVDGVAVNQDARGSLQQLGVGGTVTPVETTNIFWSYAWSRDEYNADFFSTTTRRFDATPRFYSRDDRQTYLLGSHTLTVGADATTGSRVTYGVSYTATRTAGDAASGRVLASLPVVDGRIENWYHTAASRVEWDLGRSVNLGITYLLDYYSDASFADLTGGLNTFFLGIGYRF